MLERKEKVPRNKKERTENGWRAGGGAIYSLNRLLQPTAVVTRNEETTTRKTAHYEKKDKKRENVMQLIDMCNKLPPLFFPLRSNSQSDRNN